MRQAQVVACWSYTLSSAPLCLDLIRAWAPELSVSDFGSTPNTWRASCQPGQIRGEWAIWSPGGGAQLGRHRGKGTDDRDSSLVAQYYLFAINPILHKQLQCPLSPRPQTTETSKCQQCHLTRPRFKRVRLCQGHWMDQRQDSTSGLQGHKPLYPLQ